MSSPDILHCAVCGVALDSDVRTPSVLFRGRRFHFCRDPDRDCRLAFKRAPERHADANPAAGELVRPAVPPRERVPGPFVIRVDPTPAQDGDKPE